MRFLHYQDKLLPTNFLKDIEQKQFQITFAKKYWNMTFFLFFFHYMQDKFNNK